MRPKSPSKLLRRSTGWVQKKTRVKAERLSMGPPRAARAVAAGRRGRCHATAALWQDRVACSWVVSFSGHLILSALFAILKMLFAARLRDTPGGGARGAAGRAGGRSSRQGRGLAGGVGGQPGLVLG